MGTEKYFLQKTLYLYEKYQIYLRHRFQASLKYKTFIVKCGENRKLPARYADFDVPLDPARYVTGIKTKN